MRTKHDIVFNDLLLECNDMIHLDMKDIKKYLTVHNIEKCYSLLLANVIMANGMMTKFLGVEYPSIYHIDDFITNSKSGRRNLMLAFIYIWIGE